MTARSTASRTGPSGNPWQEARTDTGIHRGGPRGLLDGVQGCCEGGWQAPNAVRQWLLHSRGSIPNYWRVLNAQGQVPDGSFGAGSGPLDASSARDLLRREGVWIDAHGIARQEQRFTVEDWIRFQTGGGARQLRLPTRPAHGVASQPTRAPRPGELRIGGTVRVREESGEVITRKIVNPDAGDRSEGELSARSPVGRALLGHVAGDVVVVEIKHGPR
jgi:hypothetical protein